VNTGRWPEGTGPARYDELVTWRPFETTLNRAARLAARSVALLAAAAVGSVAITACGASGEPTADVLAASSFIDVAEPLEALLESELDIDVRFSFGSSGSFLQQIDQGAPAAAVITADTDTMRRIEEAGLVEPSVPITKNELIIVTSDTEKARSISSLSDLAQDGTIVVVCTSSAPCGTATDELLASAGVALSPASREPNVRATLTKVLLGEADAAIVYRTDALAHPELRTVDVGPDNVGVIGQAAVVTRDGDGANGANDIGVAILDVLTGEKAAELLAEAGFSQP
jgi:molybdate transport system substrate-binding protein